MAGGPPSTRDLPVSASPVLFSDITMYCGRLRVLINGRVLPFGVCEEKFAGEVDSPVNLDPMGAYGVL